VMYIKIRSVREFVISILLLCVFSASFYYVEYYNHKVEKEYTVSIEQVEDLQEYSEYIIENGSDLQKNDLKKRNRSVSLDLSVEVINQMPNMPSGCEVTSLTMVLNYLGIEVTNYYLADNYLPNDTYDLNRSFVGNVYANNSFGCYAPVITKTANDYLKSIKSDYKAFNITGSSRKDLLSYVASGIPVIIWNTEEMAETEVEYYYFEDEEMEWHTNEHCVVLCGYNMIDNTVTVADSISGYVYRDADTFFSRYEDLEEQAVIIKKRRK